MKKSFLSMMATVVVFSLVAVGCGTQEEPAVTGAAPSNQDQTNTEASNEEKSAEEEAKELEKAKLKAVASARLSDEKITSIFETKTVGDKDINVAKANYATIDDVKAYWSNSMSDNFVNENAQYLKEEELPELGKKVTLTLPEDYISLSEISFTDVNLDDVTVDGEKATVSAKVNEKTLTYDLVKKSDVWVVDKKTVQ